MMREETKANRKNQARIATLTLAVTLLLVLVGPAPAPATSGTLPDGTSLEVTITSPADGETVAVAPGETLDVDLAGTASVGAVDQVQATLVYVVDVSGSVTSTGGPCGDVNQDQRSNSVLDCEAAAVLALNEAAASSGTVNRVGLVLYGDNGAIAVVNPSGNSALLTQPDADLNGNTIADMEEVVRSLRVGGVDLFSPRNVGQLTNFEEGLAHTDDLLSQTSGHDRIIVTFLSDGVPTRGSSTGVQSWSDQLAAKDAVIHTFAVGSQSTCTGGARGTLQQISDTTGGTCSQITDPSQLPDILPELLSSSLDAIEVSANGGPGVTVAPEAVSLDLPAAGAATATWIAAASGLGPGAHELCATAQGTDAGGTGSVTDCVTVNVATMVGVDVRPGSCPNPFNSKARGVLPAAIVGTDGLDVAQIDVDSLRLAGVAPIRGSFEDVATPFEPILGKTESDDCTDERGDGTSDLALKFRNRDIAQAIGPVERGETVVVPLTGEFLDGTSFLGEDVLRIVR